MPIPVSSTSSTATTALDYMRSIQNMDAEFQSYMILSFCLIVIVFFLGYLYYLSRLKERNIAYMNDLYPSLSGYIRPITSVDPDCSGNLCDYYVKTAFNSCSGGSYKNAFVSVDILKALLKQGVRGLDFEIYSVDDQPVVATSTNDSYYVKETFNYVPFADVMKVIRNYAFSSGTSPNSTDPLLIHLRCKSNNQKIYSRLADLFKEYSDIMLGMNYSFEADGKNLGEVPLLELQNKVVLIMDRSHTAFLENEELLEFVNLTSNSLFMRIYDYYDVKNTPDVNELTEFNRRGMTIVVPDNGPSPENPSGIVCRASGCQMVAMRYQYVDDYLTENALFFDRAGYAFALKPEPLRYRPVIVADPTPQKPEYSYATRTSATDYYQFDF